jgi:hypothetical protein
MQQLVVLQVKQNADQLKLAWGMDGLMQGTYTVDRDMISRDADKIRLVLDRLVERALENNQQNTKPPCGDLLKELAERGSDLYHSLFSAEEGAEESEKIAKWLDELEHPFTMRIIVEPRIHIPWGLVYDADPQNLTGKPGDTNWELFQDFWNVKYDVSCLYYRIPPSQLRTVEPTSYRVLPIVNQASFSTALNQLAETEKKVLTKFFEKCEPPVYSKKELFMRWPATKETVGMLFFFCHADQTRLALGQDQLDIDDFKRYLRLDSRQLKEPSSFVFLNGCRTAVGDPGGGFIEATGRTGYCGFIGTEAEIPDLFALRFSTAFMYCLYYEGLSILETMKRLRKQHWPVSILYSVCCEPRLMVKGLGPQEAFSAFLGKNFSAMPVGSTQKQDSPNAGA